MPLPAAQAARSEAIANGTAVPTPRQSNSKRQRREAAEARAPGSVAEAVAGELRRNKLSAHINYEVVKILAQTLDEDAEQMPTGPGPIGGAIASPSSSIGRSQISAGNTSDRRDYSENLSVASSNDVGDTLYEY
jgi:hypothetical protein